MHISIDLSTAFRIFLSVNQGKRLNYDFAREFMPEEEDAVYAIFWNKGA